MLQVSTGRTYMMSDALLSSN